MLAAQAATAQTPAQEELSPENAAGSYLAARHAGAERDAAAAATYYMNVLKLDPRNPDLLSRAFLSVLTDGDIDQASKLADRMLEVDHTDRISHLVIGIRELKQKHYGAAKQNFAQSVRGPVTDLTAALLTAWAQYGAGDAHARGRHHGQAVRAGLVRHLQGPACRLHPRSRRRQERRPEALRKRLQDRSDGAAHGGGLWPLPVAQRQQGRCAESLSGLRQGPAGPSARSTKR